ncbi:MAG: CvpA family protein [Myxococcota bacterium]|jgi:uncharacterized membrane protein required for colicin V production|nr:CvpA family protein [Myxococcota bacterium]
MGGEGALTLLDGTVLVILLIGITRGIFIGMVRESLSMAGLGAAVLAARYGTPTASVALQELTQGAVGPGLAPWLAGSALGIGTIIAMTLISRVIQRGVRAAGLNWLDRSGGALLGMAEGVLVSILVVLGATLIFGREHPSIDGSRSVAAYDSIRSYMGDKIESMPELPDPSELL